MAPPARNLDSRSTSFFPEKEDDEAPATIREPSAPDGCELEEDEFSLHWCVTKVSVFGFTASNENSSSRPEPHGDEEPQSDLSILRVICMSTPDPVVLPYTDPFVWRWFVRVGDRMAAIVQTLSRRLGWTIAWCTTRGGTWQGTRLARLRVVNGATSSQRR